MIDEQTTIQEVSDEAFEAFITRPENADRRFERINGEIIELVSNNFASEIAGIIVYFIHTYLRENKLGGRVTVADGGYVIGAERYIPDVAFTRAERRPHPTTDAYSSVPPDLAVEVISNPDNRSEDKTLRNKVINYLNAGVTVWVVDYADREVEVYAPNMRPLLLRVNDTIEGGAVLPGFSLPVREIFPEMPSEEASAKES